MLSQIIHSVTKNCYDITSSMCHKSLCVTNVFCMIVIIFETFNCISSTTKFTVYHLILRFFSLLSHLSWCFLFAWNRMVKVSELNYKRVKFSKIGHEVKNAGVNGSRIFTIDSARSCTGRGNILKLKVNFSHEIITLYREVRNLRNLGFRSVNASFMWQDLIWVKS